MTKRLIGRFAVVSGPARALGLVAALAGLAAAAEKPDAQGGRAASQTVLPRHCGNPLPLVAGIPAQKTSLCGFVVQEKRGKNVALGKKYTLQPTPAYQHCTDPDDKTQLTDGKLTTDYFWTQKGTVGWSGVRYVVINVDLGRVEPICGVSFRTAAGTAGVGWPGAIYLQTSDDGKTYREAGELVALDHKTAGPWPKGYAVRRLATSTLRTRGRFVRFVVLPLGSPYTFVDEVEVFRGPDELLRTTPAGKPAEAVEVVFKRWRVRGAVRRRYESDVASIREAVQDTDLSAQSKKELLGRVAQIAKTLEEAAVSSAAPARAVLPLSQPHARLFEVQADLWSRLGRPSLCAWVPPVWDPLDLFALPPAPSSGGIEVHAMQGEYRAAALNLASTAKGTREVRLHSEGLPGGPVPGYVTVAGVPWTDTAQGRPVAAALPEAKRDGKRWRLAARPGMVGQVWLMFHVVGIPPGDHSGTIFVEADGTDPLRVPVRLHVYPMKFPEKTTLSLGGWSYTNGGGAYGVGAANRREFLEHLRRHFVNAPWASSSVMMKFEFTKDGAVQLDTKAMDDWLDQWPDAKAYMVFLSLGDYSRSAAATFRGAKLGSAEFNRRVAVWISAWVDHLRKRRISPGQLALHIHDEPHEGTDVGPMVAWAKAIRAAQPEVVIWNDPTYRNPAKAPPELFEVCDVICPNRPMWLASRKLFDKFYLDQKSKGRTLQLYSCSGPARLLDPYSYYRLQAWHCWQIGATGSYFWAFGDNGGSSSWNEYLAGHGPYAPLFIDERTVTAGKQMEAIRESVQDYETLVMLREALRRAKAAGRSDDAVTRAQQLLATAAAEVLDARDADKINWHDPKDRSRADAVRVRVLRALVALR